MYLVIYLPPPFFIIYNLGGGHPTEAGPGHHFGLIGPCLNQTKIMLICRWTNFSGITVIETTRACYSFPPDSSNMQFSYTCYTQVEWAERRKRSVQSIISDGSRMFRRHDNTMGPRGPVVSTLSFNLSAESRGAGSIPAICPGRCMSLSCAVKFPVAILYGVVICNFDEDL